MLATPELIREAAQWTRLEKLRARWRKVPLYRSRLPKGPRFAREHLARLPFITKCEMRAGFPANFLPSEAALETLLSQNLVELEYTSGTSEERTPVLFRRGWWDEQEQRALRLNRFVARVLDEHPNARRVTLTTPACNGRSCPTVWQPVAQRTFGATRFVNLARIPFALSDAELDRMAAEILEWAPQFLDVSPVHAVRFALYCERNAVRFPSLRFLLCSYEFVSVVHRRILQRVFGVPVFNLYGSTETGHLLMEDDRGEMKPAYDTALLEVVEPDTAGVGDLVVTTLTNDYMPLLRYRIGDLVERQERPYRTSYRVHGRRRDALRRADGRRVTTLEVDECFDQLAGIAHYQLGQNAQGECALKWIPDGPGPAPEDLQTLVARLQALVQVPGRILTERVPLLLPAPSGKFRLTFPV
jgi:phenylacetate-CoA ligase